MEIERLLAEIRTDRTSGATAVAERALDAMARSRAARGLLLGLRPGLPLLAGVVRLARRRGVAAARKALRAGRERLLERIRDVLPPGARCASFGPSSTVAAVRRALGAVDPGSGRPDVALVGAHVLLPGGEFINARGTAAFLRRAREQRAAVFVVATELKRVRVAPVLDPGMERVPARLVHAILTETGVHYPPGGPPAGVEPTWLDRGALNPLYSRGLCHPHHERRPDR